MMSNLFSSFNPTSSFNLSLNWMSSLILIILIPNLFWILPNRISLFFKLITSSLHKELKILTKLNSSTLIFISLLIFILTNNFLGLYPYIFTSSSHMTFTLSLAFPLWISFMLFGWFTNTYHMLAHLMPQGTPPLLMPLMICIETVSNIIRPLTLAIRLSANMIAGHLLLTLLGNTGPFLNYLLIFLIFTQLLLFILECAVAMIQAYVFSILSTLYSSEVIYVPKSPLSPCHL
uniref:ATP synthase subunit a n=1 Tax=Rodolia quadrimaculata TaxID=2678939 RepID=A0A6B9MWE1_9CUCU|nr:ATP synthase F0 subunit 6 [Rodolia quadrimaculata]